MKTMNGIPGALSKREENEKRWRKSGIIECRKERALLVRSGSKETDPVVVHLDEVIASLAEEIAAKYPESRGLLDG